MNKHTQTEMEREDIIKHPEYLKYAQGVDSCIENLKWHYNEDTQIHLLFNDNLVVGVVASTDFGYVYEVGTHLELPKNIEDWLCSKKFIVSASIEATKTQAIWILANRYAELFVPYVEPYALSGEKDNLKKYAWKMYYITDKLSQRAKTV
jgi:hypothetical protein